MISPYKRVQQTDEHVLAYTLFESTVSRKSSVVRRRNPSTVHDTEQLPERVVSDFLSHFAGSPGNILQESLCRDIVDAQ